MSDAQTDVKSIEVDVSTELKNIIEALIFASDEPMTVRFIRSIVDDVNKNLLPSDQIVLNADIIRKAVGDLNRGYGRLGSGFRIIEVAGGFVYATQEQFASWVGKLAKERARRRLSPTAVETLAIIAYKQPITKAEVEFIRGVNVDYIINALLEKDLIHITGRQSSPGRPLLYGTTQKFLEHFGLNELTDLPKPREIAELISETELEVDRRMLAEQQEMEFQVDLEKKLEGHEGTARKGKSTKQPKSSGKRSGNEIGETSVPISEIQGEGDIPEHQSKDHSDSISENIIPVPVGVKEPGSDDGIALDIPVQDVTLTTEKAEEGVLPSINQVIIEKESPPEKSGDTPETTPKEVNLTDTDTVEQEADHEKGWSKWKSRVKTFFKKLFG